MPSPRFGQERPEDAFRGMELPTVGELAPPQDAGVELGGRSERVVAGHGFPPTGRSPTRETAREPTPPGGGDSEPRLLAGPAVGRPAGGGAPEGGPSKRRPVGYRAAVGSASITRGIVVLALLAGCGEPTATPPRAPTAPAPAARAPQPSEGGTGIVLPEDRFPDLGAFRSGGWWELFGADPKDSKRLLDMLRRFPEDRARMKEVMHRESATDGVLDRPPEPAELGPRMPIEQRVLYGMLPNFFAVLEPLWDRASWSDDDVALAREVGKFLHTELEAPDVPFDGSATDRAAALRRLTTWFRDQLGRVDRYAAMNLTMDDGPFVGVPGDAPAEAPPVVARLRDDLRIEAWKLEREGADVAIFAARRGTETLWCRRVTRGNGTPYARVRLDPLTVDDLGPYGFRIHFSAGGEHAHLYVGPDGRFLFYFVSW